MRKQLVKLNTFRAAFRKANTAKNLVLKCLECIQEVNKAYFKKAVVPKSLLHVAKGRFYLWIVVGNPGDGFPS